MTLDFIDNINVHGENIVRLYEFDHSQADRFRELLIQVIIINKEQLELSTIDFIQSRNCFLTLRLSNEDTGITTSDKINFFCDLTPEGYERIIALLEPFSKKDTKGYQWLYDIDNPTDFLFSPAGTW